MEAMLNHLWQSTLFAGLAGLLTLALRGNRAQARYAVWLAASIKFLIPFSLLVSMGGHFQWPVKPAIVQTGFSAVVEQVSEPFAVEAPPTTGSLRTKESVLPRLLWLAWACGFVAIVMFWGRRWRQIHAGIRSAVTRDLGLPIPATSCATLLEPGVFGIFRPVLLLPEGITERLTTEQLDAILAHEMSHVRRRDNLATAMHMLVEAVFWFHPLVWWLGARMIEERERACDESVLRTCHPQAYAEGILKVCEFYLASPLQCAAGVTGADLNRRIEDIMTKRIGRQLGSFKKMLLAGAGILAVAGPIAIGVTNPPPIRAQSTTHLAFEAISVKPVKVGDGGLIPPQFRPGGRFVSRAPLLAVIGVAYDVPLFNPHDRISGGPDWIRSPESIYDIEATAPKGAIPDDLPAKEAGNRKRSMLQALLADRFKLVIRGEAKEMSVYALVVGKDGPKLQKADIEEKDCPDGPRTGPSVSDLPCHDFDGGRGRGLHGRAVTVTDLANAAQNWADRPIVDKTGIKGLYHIETKPWLPMDYGLNPPAPGTRVDGVDVGDLATIFELFEKLGLKLDGRKDKVDVYVIDHIEKPSEN
jgi:bla regulator protein BlaR1